MIIKVMEELRKESSVEDSAAFDQLKEKMERENRGFKRVKRYDKQFR